MVEHERILHCNFEIFQSYGVVKLTECSWYVTITALAENTVSLQLFQNFENIL